MKMLLVLLLLMANRWVSSFVRLPLKYSNENRATRYYSNGLDDNMIENIKNTRATVLKKLLQAENVNCKGLFDKTEFVEKMIQHENDKINRCRSIPLLKMSFPKNPDRFYHGIELIINGQKLKFFIDTGASVSLLSKNSAMMLKLIIKDQKSFTQTLGGENTPLSSSIAFLDQLNFLGRSFPFQFKLLEDMRCLPIDCLGLLGLDFFNALNTGFLFDFDQNKIVFGDSSDLIPSLEKPFYHNIEMKLLFNGLRTIETKLTSPDPINKKEIICTAMVDLGSLYTITNPLTAKALQIDPTNFNLARLPATSTIGAGIDGNPVQLKDLKIKSLKFGEHVEVPCTGLFCGDIPGLTAIGLNSAPAMILGLDVLKRVRPMFDLKRDVFSVRYQDNT